MEKVRWKVSTECGTFVSYALTDKRAIWNVRFKIVMSDREYSRPTPRDLALMRDIEVYSCVAS